jgi:hypothetical protein
MVAVVSCGATMERMEWLKKNIAHPKSFVALVIAILIAGLVRLKDMQWTKEMPELNLDHQDVVLITTSLLSAAFAACAAFLAAFLAMKNARKLELEQHDRSLRAIGARISIADGVIRAFVELHDGRDGEVDYRQLVLRMTSAKEELFAVDQLLESQLQTLTRIPDQQLEPVLELLAFCKMSVGDLRFILEDRSLDSHARQNPNIIGTFAGVCRSFLDKTERINPALASVKNASAALNAP